MKGTFFVIVSLGLVSLSSFFKESNNYEQIAFDYFVSDILGNDFKDVSSFAFKGETEDSYKTLGKYKFCLSPEKLGSIMGYATKGSRRNVTEINYEDIKGLTILDVQRKAAGYRLFIYPSVRVADNYYVFLSFKKQKENSVRYVFELTPEGKILRSCKLD